MDFGDSTTVCNRTQRKPLQLNLEPEIVVGQIDHRIDRGLLKLALAAEGDRQVIPGLPSGPGGGVGGGVKLGHMRHDVMTIRHDRAAPKRRGKVIFPVRFDRFPQLPVDKPDFDATEQGLQGPGLKVKQVVPNRLRDRPGTSIGSMKSPEQRHLTMLRRDHMGAVPGCAHGRRRSPKGEIGAEMAKDCGVPISIVRLLDYRRQAVCGGRDDLPIARLAPSPVGGRSDIAAEDGIGGGRRAGRPARLAEDGIMPVRLIQIGHGTKAMR
jgi:hypothetical protein